MENSFLELRKISKHFGDCYANRDVSFSVQKGTIHAIVGENGAGKSTAMKILYGQYAPSTGEIFFRGKICKWKSPHDAIRSGIGMVHQHFMLAGPHTALENILLGMQRWPWSSMDKVRARKRLQEIMTEYGIHVDLEKRVEECSVGVQQRIEILKLLYRDSEVLILDEPTAVLAPSEIEVFFNLLRKMAETKTILIITHKLKEVMSLASDVTVFRAGVVVAQRKTKDITIPELAALMVGQEIQLDTKLSRASPGEVFLEAKNLKLKALEEINFNIRSGEILGIAGVEGNGQSEFIHSLLSPKTEFVSGRLFWRGENISKCSTEEIRSKGFAILPEDRLKEGLLLSRSLLENFVLRWRNFPEFKKGFFLRMRELKSKALEEITKYAVRPLDIHAISGELSGGNQQKMVVARELFGNPKFLLAAQPTRGVDIGAVQFIHDKILEKKNEGAAVLLISSELDEVMKLSDRILVMFGGKFVAEFSREEFNEQKIGFFMMGGEKNA